MSAARWLDWGQPTCMPRFGSQRLDLWNRAHQDETGHGEHSVVEETVEYRDVEGSLAQHVGSQFCQESRVPEQTDQAPGALIHSMILLWYSLLKVACLRRLWQEIASLERMYFEVRYPLHGGLPTQRQNRNMIRWKGSRKDCNGRFKDVARIEVLVKIAC